MPESFVTINFVTYFRLENGKLAVGDHGPSFVRLDTSRQDSVELITLDEYQKIVQFWKINDKFYSLNLSSYIEISDQITFVDYYFSNDYSDEVYIKYFEAGKGYGIIYVYKSRITHLIASSRRFTEISFEDDLFYAKDAKNKYHIIDINANELGVFATKCKKTPGFSIFYDNKKIYGSSSEVEVPNGIETLELVAREDWKLLKISNASGIYYYSRRLEYILGPIKKDRITSDYRYTTSSNCLIYEIIDEKVTQVFYVTDDDNCCFCRNLSCKDGINTYYEGGEYYFLASNTFYHYCRATSKFVPIINGVDADSYSIISKRGAVILIVAYKNENPFYIAQYFTKEEKVIDDGLEYLCSGFKKDTYIFKDNKNNSIFGITKNGEKLFFTYGINCEKIKLYNSAFNFSALHDAKSIEVYMVEVKKGIFKLFSSNGEELLLRQQ